MKHSTTSILLSTILSLGVWADNNLVSSPSKDNSPDCDCYLVDGTDPGYFQYFRFWDFRNIANDGNDDFTQAPELLTSSVSGSESITSSYFNTSSFTTDWSIQQGPQSRASALTAIDTAQNIYISRNSTDGAESPTYLTFRTNRIDNVVATSEIDSNQNNILHCSFRGRFRVIPNSLSDTSAPFSGDRILNDNDNGSNSTHPVNDGAVFGFFTYLSDTQESDIEILTSDPTNAIRYSNQPDYDAKTDSAVPGASTETNMPAGTDWTQWQDHRLDWYDGISRWYVNDQLVLEKKLNVPSKPSGVIVNLWSDGGNWSGNLTDGAQVTVGVQWIELVFNTSGKVNTKREVLEKRKSQPCGTGCNVDSVTKVGFPEVAFSNPSSAANTLKSGGGSLVACVAAMILSSTLVLV